jgi:hypothetical protein
VRPSTLLLFFFSCAVGAATACADPSGTSDDNTSNESNIGEGNDLFGPATALEIKISAPLTQLFTRYNNGQADPPKPPKDAGPDASPPQPVVGQEPDFSEPGKLTLSVDDAEQTLDMHVYIRGESSKSDCPFPKLKIDFDNKDQLKGTPFKGHGKFRLNTHCGPGDASARSGMGRVFNGVGPVREELTYRMIRAMGIPTYQTRVLAVHYEDTSANNAVTDSLGVAIEAGDDAAQRFKKTQPPLIPDGAEYLDPFTAAAGHATPENLAQITVAEDFSGNKDWGGTHNVDSFGMTPPTDIFQIAQDFDLGAIVLGDIAHYWKGEAAASEAQASLRVGNVAKLIASHKDDVMTAYREAEKGAIAAKAIASADGAITTDPGFLEAKKRMEELYALPEVVNAFGGDAGAADAGKD